MTKTNFKKFVDKMVEIYGVRSYLNNIEEDMTQEEIDEDLWFECPECGEPILWDDYDMNDYIDGDIWTCPICEEELDI